MSESAAFTYEDAQAPSNGVGFSYEEANASPQEGLSHEEAQGTSDAGFSYEEALNEPPSFMDQMGGGIDSVQSSFQKTGALIADKAGADEIAQGLRNDATANDEEAAKVQYQSKHGDSGWKQALNLSDPEWWKATIAEAIPGSAPFLAGAVAGAAATPLPHPVAKLIGAGLGGGAAVVLQEVGPAYEEHLQAHPDDTEGATDYAIKKAGLTGVINAASIGLGPLGYGAGAIKHALIQMAVQPAVGVADTVAGNAMEQANIDPNTPLSRGVAKAAVGEIAVDAPGTVAIVRNVMKSGQDTQIATDVDAEDAAAVAADGHQVEIAQDDGVVSVEGDPVTAEIRPESGENMAVTDQAAPKVPEPASTIEAQIDAFNDGRKPAVLITPGEDTPQIPEGAKSFDLGDSGTLIFKDNATLAKALNPETLGEALGFGTGAKPESPTNAIVSKDAQGRIVAEQLTDEKDLDLHASVIGAGRILAGEGGSIELQSIGQVLQQRQEAVTPSLSAEEDTGITEGVKATGEASVAASPADLQQITADMQGDGMKFRKGEAELFHAGDVATVEAVRSRVSLKLQERKAQQEGFAALDEGKPFSFNPNASDELPVNPSEGQAGAAAIAKLDEQTKQPDISQKVISKSTSESDIAEEQPVQNADVSTAKRMNVNTSKDELQTQATTAGMQSPLQQGEDEAVSPKAVVTQALKLERNEKGSLIASGEGVRDVLKQAGVKFVPRKGGTALVAKSNEEAAHKAIDTRSSKAAVKQPVNSSVGSQGVQSTPETGMKDHVSQSEKKVESKSDQEPPNTPSSKIDDTTTRLEKVGQKDNPVSPKSRSGLSKKERTNLFKDGTEVPRSKLLSEYYSPGRIVKSYGGHDRVISLDEKDGGEWSVKVIEVTKDDNGEWIDAGDVREHSTFPERKSMAAAFKSDDESASPEKQSGENIEDFGEKLGGAKKDTYNLYRDQMAKAGEYDVNDVPLSKSWPEPDYKKLLEGGIDKKTVAFIRAARDEIPNKPRDKYKLARWTPQVKLLRSLADDLLQGHISVDRLFTELSLEKYNRLREGISGRIELYEKIGHERSMKGIAVTVGRYSMYDGVKHDPAKTIWSVSQKKKATAFGNMPRMLGKGDTREKAVESFVKNLDKIDSLPASEKRKKSGFDVYHYQDKPDMYWIGKKIGKNRADLKSFDSLDSAKAYLNDNQSSVEELLARYKILPGHRRETNRERSGVDYRNGEDVTPEMFSDAFGFRGVEFGNWVKATGERQGHLNRAYDALMDLANLINIPPLAISLNGELGLAFGARGSGGADPAAAHYEPDFVAINLTRKNGAGSLAHEWFHAMDNYFSRSRRDPSGMMTDKPYHRGAGVRREVSGAFKDIVDALKKTGMEKRAAELDKRRSKPYWATSWEQSARAFESYAIDKLAQSESVNDYLANVQGHTEFTRNMLESLLEGKTAEESYPYLLDSEMDGVRTVYDKFFETLKTKETDKGVALFSRTKGDKSAVGRSSEELSAIMDKVIVRVGNRWPVHTLHTFGDLPVSIQKQADTEGHDGNDVDGVFHKGNVYLIRDNLARHSDPELKVEEALLHEFAHGDIRAMFGEEMAAKLNVLFAASGGYKGIKAIADKHGIDLRPYSKSGALAGMASNKRQNLIMDEILAHLAQEKPNTAKRIKEIVGMIRQWLRDHGFAKLAKYGETDLLNVLREARKVTAKNVSGRATFMVSKHEPNGMSGFDGFVDDHNKAIKSLPWDSIVGFAKDKRRILMGALTNLQLGEVYAPALKGMEGGNPLTNYNTSLQNLEAERNGALHEAELIDQSWDSLNGKEADAVGTLMNDATVYAIHPDKAFESQMPELQKKLQQVRSEEEGTEVKREIQNEKHRKLAYPNLSKRYQALSNDAKGVYANVRDLYTQQWNKTQAEMINRVARNIPDESIRKQSITEIRLAFRKAIQIGPYFPLARFGDFVTIARKDGDYIRDHHATSAKQKKAAVKYRKAGFTVSRVKGEEFGAGDLGNAPAFAQDVFELLNKYGLKESDLADDVNQLMLRMMPDMSALKHNIHRKRVKGYSGDARRAFAHTVFHGAHHLSRIMFADRMQNEITRIKDEIGLLQSGKESVLEDGNLAVDLLNEMKVRHEKIMNPNSHPLTSHLGSLGFIWYLGASPAAGIVNMTQTPLVTLPMLAGKYGWSKSSAALMRAMKDYARAPFKAGSYEAWVSLDRSNRIAKSERALIEELIKDGTLDITQAHALAQLSETDTRHNAKGEMSQGRTKAMRYIGAFFHNAEVVNRQVSALAAYRLAKGTGVNHEEAVNQARKVVFDSHFNYASSNRPRYLKGDVVRTLTMFKQYSQHMTYALLRNFNQSFKGETPEVRKQARNTLSGILVQHALAAGTLGLPLAGVIFSTLDLAFDDEDEPFDSKVAYRNWLADTFGTKVGEAIAKGPVNAYTPIDLHSRVSLDELWLRTPDRDLTGKQEALYYMQQAAGPIGALFLNVWSGAGSIAEGHVERGFEKMVPKFVRDFARSARYHEEGLRTYNGDPIIEETTPAEEAFQAIGFSPSRAGERYEARSAVKKQQMGINDRRKQLLNWYAEGIRDNDNQKLNDVIDKISLFNGKNPSRVIDAKTLKRSLKTRASRSGQTDHGIYLPKGSKHLMEEARFAE